MARTLPEELIFDILSWLPVKDLLRFKCVCKSWRILIARPRFVKSHLERSIETHKLNLIVSSGSHIFNVRVPNRFKSSDNHHSVVASTDLIGLSFKDSPVSIRQILSCCDGLACLVETDCHSIFLLNPFTRELKKLPELSAGSFGSFHHYSSIWGFGYCPQAQEFKVVTIHYFKSNWVSSEKQTQVLLLTVGSNSWRSIAEPPAHVYPGTQIIVNGACHWRGRGITESDTSLKIVSFHVEDEDFRELAYPEYQDGRYSMDFLGVLRGCLCVFRSLYNGLIEVWVMEEYGIKESWKPSFSITESVLGYNKSLIAHQPFWVLPSGEILAVFLDEKMVLYDPCTGCVRELAIPGIEGCWFEALVCVENLVPLKG